MIIYDLIRHQWASEEPERPPRTEKADCDFKVWAAGETDESALPSSQTDVVSLLLAQKCRRRPARDIWHPDVCHYSP